MARCREASCHIMQPIQPMEDATMKGLARTPHEHFEDPSKYLARYISHRPMTRCSLNADVPIFVMDEVKEGSKGSSGRGAPSEDIAIRPQPKS